MKYLIPLTLLIFLFFSCDPLIEYNFYITNKSNKNITVMTDFNGKIETNKLKVNDNINIYTWTEVTSAKDDYFKDEIYILNEINVFVNDSIQLNIDLKNRDKWFIKWANNYTGNYYLVIDNEMISSN